MENTIRQVLEIEMRARKIVQEAKEMKQEMKAEALRTMRDLEENACFIRKDEIDKLRKEKLDAAVLQAEEITRQARIKADDLKKKYEENGRAWAIEVFRKITSV